MQGLDVKRGSLNYLLFCYEVFFILVSLNQQRIEILTGGIYLTFYNILIKFNIFTSYSKRKNLSKFEYFIKSRVVSRQHRT